ncbi:MAG: hypothetical protein ACK58T_29265 [Phycisphaerae bacterium]|jgi:hypothetical protein
MSNGSKFRVWKEEGVGDKMEFRLCLAIEGRQGLCWKFPVWRNGAHLSVNQTAELFGQTRRGTKARISTDAARPISDGDLWACLDAIEVSPPGAVVDPFGPTAFPVEPEGNGGVKTPHVEPVDL